MVVFWVRVPEVAVTVTICIPAGVPGALGAVGAGATGEAAEFMEPEHPTANPVDASRSTTSPRSCNGFPLLIARLREKIRIEPKGMRNATAMMDAPLVQGTAVLKMRHAGRGLNSDGAGGGRSWCYGKCAGGEGTGDADGTAAGEIHFR
jgi:hypothetical protein